MNESAESTDGRPPRQMGRRTGRFKKNTTPDPLSPHGSLPPPGNPLDTSRHSAHSVMQDLFVENVRKPVSRRASISSSSKDELEGEEDADGEVNMGDRRNPLRKSTSSLGRTDSYRRAKNQDPLADPLAMTRRPAGTRGPVSYTHLTLPTTPYV